MRGRMDGRRRVVGGGWFWLADGVERSTGCIDLVVCGVRCVCGFVGFYSALWLLTIITTSTINESTRVHDR